MVSSIISLEVSDGCVGMGGKLEHNLIAITAKIKMRIASAIANTTGIVILPSRAAVDVHALENVRFVSRDFSWWPPRFLCSSAVALRLFLNYPRHRRRQRVEVDLQHKIRWRPDLHNASLHMQQQGLSNDSAEGPGQPT